MANGSIASKDIISWIVNFLIGLIPLLIFYLNYRIDKKKANKKILELEEMLYKIEIKTLKKENEELKKENERLKEENKELKKGKR